MALTQAPLMLQEGRALHEKHRERRHADIRHRIGLVCPLTLVREGFATLAHTVEQGLEEAGHAGNESYVALVSEAPFGGQRRILGGV